MSRRMNSLCGLHSMLHDIGVDTSIALSTDSSAAQGIASRRGLGKVRHIELSELWLQDQVARNRIVLHKISGEDKFSDSLTKHATAERIAQTLLGSSQ